MTKFDVDSTLYDILNGASGALFEIPKDKRRENGPVKEGVLEKRRTLEDGSWRSDFRLPIAAFPRKQKDGAPYYSVVIAGRLLSFGLFKESEKRSDSSPDATGSIGGELRVAGWTRASKEGVKYTSLLVSEKQRKEQESPAEEEYAEMGDTDDDDIPF